MRRSHVFRGFPALPALPGLALAALGLLLAATPSAAQPRQRIREGPCKADIERLCAGVPHGGGAVLDCLKQKESQLSKECRDDMAAHRQRAQQRIDALKASCKDDLARFCADVEPGGGGLARCLRGHEADLSASCRDALPRRGGRRQPD
jgi:hypothetical protein